MTEQIQQPQAPYAPHEPQPAYTPQKRLTRNREDGMVSGVCAGVAEYTGLDVTLVRVLTVLGVLVGFGSVAVAYLIGWLLIPKA